MSEDCVNQVKQEMYNSFQELLDAYALVENSTASSEEEEKIIYQNYLNRRNKFCENYLEKALTICLKNYFDNSYEALPVFTDYRKMNTQYAFHVLNDANEIESRIIQPFGLLTRWHTGPLVALSSINNAEVTLTFTPKTRRYKEIYGYGELTKDGLIFHCDDHIGSSKLDWLCNPYQSSWGNVVKMGFEDLGEFEELGENKYKRNMLLSTIAVVNGNLSYLPNLINLIDISSLIVPCDNRKCVDEYEKYLSSYFKFVTKFGKPGLTFFHEYWKEFSSLHWDVVKKNLCVTDSRRILFKSEPIYCRGIDATTADAQPVEESFDDLQSFIEWYINFRYFEFGGY